MVFDGAAGGWGGERGRWGGWRMVLRPRERRVVRATMLAWRRSICMMMMMLHVREFGLWCLVFWYEGNVYICVN